MDFPQNKQFFFLVFEHGSPISSLYDDNYYAKSASSDYCNRSDIGCRRKGKFTKQTKLEKIMNVKECNHELEIANALKLIGFHFKDHIILRRINHLRRQDH